MVHVLMQSAVASSAALGSEFPGSCHRAQGPQVTQPCLDELLGTVAHELRNPLAAALNGVYLVASERSSDPVARQALALMEQELEQAMRLVDDLFDVCAGGLGKLSLRKELVALDQVVARATESARHSLATRQHRLTVSLPPQPVFLHADPLRLLQVLTNLLSNAAKFTDRGGHIQLTAEAEAGQVVVRVRDNGRGITPDLLPRVFDLFRQGPDCESHAQAGLGIGLALVKSLVELHGGSVTAHSDGLDTGAEFVVRLPRRACRQ